MGRPILRDGASRLLRMTAGTFSFSPPAPRSSPAQRSGCAGIRIGEQLLDGALGVAAFDELPAGHHSVGVEGAHRQLPHTELLWHLVDFVERLLAFAHKIAKRMR